MSAAAAAIEALPEQRRLCVIAPTHPLTVGAAQFNAAMVHALRKRSKVEFLSWTRPYPPLLYRRSIRDERSRPPRAEPAEFLLDWADPRTWRRAIDRAEAFGAQALVLPWVHPVMAPPYLWLLRAARGRFRRIVVCHNVLPHEKVPLGDRLAKAVLRNADVIVTHAPGQLGEIAELGVRSAVIEAFHPLFVPGDLAAEPAPAEVAAERGRLGNPELLLLVYGAVRPYKGVDLAIKSLARVDPSLNVRVVVAGRFWTPRSELEVLSRSLGVGDRVDLRDGYVSNEDTALLLAASDAALLPYRSATQSGVVALALGHGRPVIATAVGGLPAAIEHGVDGLLAPAGDIVALAQAIERMAVERERLTAGARRTRNRRSFDHYAALLETAVGG